MREAQVTHVRHEVLGELYVSIEAAIRMAFPRAQMHFIDRNRRMQPVPSCAPLDPLLVTPLIAILAGHARRRPRPAFELTPVRVGLDRHLVAVARPDLVFIELPAGKAWNE